MTNIRTSYTDQVNFFGGHSPFELIRQFGSPLYVYNENMLRLRASEMRDLVKLPSFKACFSAKANGNPHLLRIIRSEGLLVDSMSPGELLMTRTAGFTKEEIIYVCNNVSDAEFIKAQEGSRIVSVDSLSQLERFGRSVPKAVGGKVKVMIRLNPGIGAGHHKKVVTAGKKTKFGIDPQAFSEALELCQKYKLELAGINQHVGSLFMQAEAFLKAAEWLLNMIESSGYANRLDLIDFGGGFGIPYHKYDQEKRLDIVELGVKLTELLRNWSEKNSYKGMFIIEPGRYVPAESGMLLGTVTATKNNGDIRFVCTDVGFNILPRPMLYDAFHDVEIYREGTASPDERTDKPASQTIVGNICESGDILAEDRLLPEIRENDILGFMDTGAYCYSMASSYNQRTRPAEILIDGQGNIKLIRFREAEDDLLGLIPDATN
jgi:diaminopimelate decarboxylase